MRGTRGGEGVRRWWGGRGRGRSYLTKGSRTWHLHLGTSGMKGTGEGEGDDDDEAGEDEEEVISPREVGHNIYILVHQVWKEPGRGRGTMMMRWERMMKKLSHQGKLDIKSTSWYIRYERNQGRGGGVNDDDEAGEDDEEAISPREVGHNIYILAHQVWEELGEGRGYDDMRRERTRKKLSHQGKSDITSTSWHIRYERN